MADATQAVEPTKAVAGQEPNTATPSTTTAPGAQDGTQGKEPPQTGAAGKVEDLPEWAQKDIREARAEAAKYRKERSEAEKAAKAADETRLAESADWQKLAEKRQTRIAELEPKSELADRLSEIVAKQLETEIATWPESVRAIMPADDSPLLERITWAERTRPLAKELMAAQGNGATATAPSVPGLRYPAQHPGGAMAPTTTKAVADSYVAKTYARPKKE